MIFMINLALFYVSKMSCDCNAVQYTRKHHLNKKYYMGAINKYIFLVIITPNIIKILLTYFATLLITGAKLVGPYSCTVLRLWK